MASCQYDKIVLNYINYVNNVSLEAVMVLREALEDNK